MIFAQSSIQNKQHASLPVLLKVIGSLVYEHLSCMVTKAYYLTLWLKQK